jgi:sugar phosphate isomerase/epimerase
MPHLGLGHLTINADPLETIDVAAAAGFRSVSIRVAGRRKSDPFRQILGNVSALKELRQRLDDTGLRLSSMMPHQFNEETVPDDLKQYAEAALILRPDYILCNDYIPDDGVLDMVASLLDDVASQKIKVTLEFVAYTQAKSLADSLAKIKRFGKPGLEVLIDSLHLNRSGGTNAEVAAVPREQLALVQLCDAKRLTHKPTIQELMIEARTARLAPGEGELDLYGFLDALPRDVEIEYEVPHPADTHLPPLEKAKRAYTAFRSFLDGYSVSRGFDYDWGYR